MAYIPGYGYVPDYPPQQGQYPQQYQYQQPIYIPNPQQNGKKGKKPSLKQLFRAKMQIEELMRNVEEHNKKNKKEDKKKRDGLNWVEFSLALILIALPIAAIELLGAVVVIKSTGLFKLING